VEKTKWWEDVIEQPGETPSARMVAVRTSIRQRGFSEKATKRISGADRQSTGAIYDSKWSIFCSWCLSKQIDPLSKILWRRRNSEKI
jgi:hypothetical protein